MKGVPEKIKPIILLLSMSLVCIGMVFIVNQFKKEPEVKEIKAQEAAVNGTVETISIDTSKPEEVRVSSKQTDKEVLGQTFSCGGNAVHIASQSTCVRDGSGTVDYKRNVTRTGTKRMQQLSYLS